MELYDYSRKDIGNVGERAVCEYLRRLGFVIIGRNIAFKTGELDIVACKNDCLHIVEVKSLTCDQFPKQNDLVFRPEENLHQAKLRKVIRTSEWYVAHVAHVEWKGEWQVDAALVWLRRGDGRARIRYVAHIA